MGRGLVGVPRYSAWSRATSARGVSEKASLPAEVLRRTPTSPRLAPPQKAVALQTRRICFLRATRALLLASIGGVLVLALLIGQALGLPEVENPIPDKIGLADVTTVAGAGGVLGGMVGVCCFPENKDRAISVGSVIGFCGGAGFYALALLVQVASGS